MDEYYDSSNKIAVRSYDPRAGKSWMQVEIYTFPDGSAENRLNAEELREVAQMLEDAADELEERND